MEHRIEETIENIASYQFLYDVIKRLKAHNKQLIEENNRLKETVRKLENLLYTRGLAE